ncbi:50S ribosomal protein L25 [Abyssisolibacter fermentans]|uniref:50S ribosomal protein L25 n=1 Tax=Abyssisolibacter fermentans TaxID=1766203 RepID=UPI000835021A|nr:50S ribosomal protein L25 [Abyssisolibacter fermentans]
MQNINIKSVIRNEIGSNACNRIRNTGFVPSVIYGHNFTNHTLKFNIKEVKSIIKKYGENAIVEVAIENTSFPAIIKEIQRDPITHGIIHLDLQQIDGKQKITTSIPILIAGRKSLDNEHILQQQLQKIDVECYPDQVPKNVLIDISKLAMNNSFKVGDVELAEDITILTNSEEIIASITTAQNNENDIDEQEDDYDYGVVPEVKSTNANKKEDDTNNND